MEQRLTVDAGHHEAEPSAFGNLQDGGGEKRCLYSGEDDAEQQGENPVLAPDGEHHLWASLSALGMLPSLNMIV